MYALQWRVEEAASVAYVELAHLFICRKHSLAKFSPQDSFGALAKTMKQWCGSVLGTKVSYFFQGLTALTTATHVVKPCQRA